MRKTIIVTVLLLFCISLAVWSENKTPTIISYAKTLIDPNLQPIALLTSPTTHNNIVLFYSYAAEGKPGANFVYKYTESRYMRKNGKLSKPTVLNKVRIPDEESTPSSLIGKASWADVAWNPYAKNHLFVHIVSKAGKGRLILRARLCDAYGKPLAEEMTLKTFKAGGYNIPSKIHCIPFGEYTFLVAVTYSSFAEKVTLLKIDIKNGTVTRKTLPSKIGDNTYTFERIDSFANNCAGMLMYYMEELMGGGQRLRRSIFTINENLEIVRTDIPFGPTSTMITEIILYNKASHSYLYWEGELSDRTRHYGMFDINTNTHKSSQIILKERFINGTVLNNGSMEFFSTVDSYTKGKGPFYRTVADAFGNTTESTKIIAKVKGVPGDFSYSPQLWYKAASSRNGYTIIVRKDTCTLYFIRSN